MSAVQQFEEGRRQENHIANDKKLNLKRIMERIKNYIILFLETSSIHGFNHLVNAGRHPCEVFIWLVMMVLSLYGTVYIALETWARYQSSPTVISMDRDMFTWSTPFPSVTICPDQKIDPTKLEHYLSNSKEVNKEKLKTFIMALANATYENFDTVPEYEGIEPQDYMETLLNLTPPFKPTITIGANEVYLQNVPTITEMGLCYTVNSKISVYNSPEYRRANRWNIFPSVNSSFMFHPLDGEVFAQVLDIFSSYNAYVHGPLEVPEIASKYHHSQSFFYMKIFITATIVYTSPDASFLSVSQRQCRFKVDNNLRHNSVYSYALCRMECRIQLCLKYCQCIPHHYRRTGDEKICDVKGLHCLSKYKAVTFNGDGKVCLRKVRTFFTDLLSEIITIQIAMDKRLIAKNWKIQDLLAFSSRSLFTDILINLRYEGGKKVDCTCFPICHNANYITQSFALERWVLGTNFQWGIITYPRIRYRRDIIFGFTDFLVAVGGMAGLLLGCSVLSFMEIVYFMSLRLIFYTRNTVE